MRHKEYADVATDLPGRRKIWLRRLGKRSFYLWIAYQTIKGTMTTVFIWAPLIYWHFIR